MNERMIGHIPKDATHWDSGDWIEWHRGVSNADEPPTSAAAHDKLARLTALKVSLLRSARSYYDLTGEHLPVYNAIAHVHAAIHFDLDLERSDRVCPPEGTEILFIPPHGPTNIVEVDLDVPFAALVVVRIKDNFSCEARMIMRASLPKDASGTFKLRWKAMPKGR